MQSKYTTTGGPSSIEFSAIAFVQAFEQIRPKTGGHLLVGLQHETGGISPYGFVGPISIDAMTHINTGLFEPTADGGWTERTQQCVGTFALVLDDVGDKVPVPDLEPTAIIETRVGSQQWWFVYNEHVDIGHGAGMATAAAEAGLSDEFIQHRPHHWARLPNSLPPQKAAERIAQAEANGTAPDMTPARLVRASWRTFGYDELAGPLSLTTTPETIEGYDGSTAFDPETGAADPLLIWMTEQGQVSRKRADLAGFRNSVCPNHAQHSDTRRPWGRYVPSNSLSKAAFKCHHSHCTDLTLRAI